jgi:signal transduction histidine kinase
MRRRLPVLFFITCIVCGSQAQFRFSHFTIRNGLSQNTVNCVLHDRQGFYWFGTQDGLNRYDGYTTRVFRHDKNDSSTVSDNFILAISEDARGNLWVSTRNGFNFFDRITEKFTRIIVNPAEKNNYHNSVRGCFIAENGDVIFSNSYQQLIRITGSDAAGPPFLPRIEKERAVLQTAGNAYYVASPDNVVSIYSNGQLLMQTTMDSRSICQAFVIDSKGRIWMARDKGLTVIVPGQSASLLLLSNHAVNVLREDSEKNIWAGTTDGLFFFRNGDAAKEPLQMVHSEDAHSIGSNNVQAIYEDRYQTIWVGTSEAGMSVHQPSVFRVMNRYSALKLSGNCANAVMQHGNELWVGTRNGVDHFVLENNSVGSAFDGGNKILGAENFTHTLPRTLCNNQVNAIARDASGNIWIGTQAGVSIYQPATKAWRQMGAGLFGGGQVFHILCASSGYTWVSATHGFFLIAPGKATTEKILVNDTLDPARSYYTFSAYEDADGSIWAGTTSGIIHVTAAGTLIETFSSRDRTSGLSYNMTTSFLRDSRKRLWVTTLGGGVNLFNDRTKKFKTYTASSGLANNIAHRIIEDRNHTLWVSTNSGLCRFDEAAQKFITYTEKDGLPANEFIQNAAFMNSAGELFFGTPEGLAVFKPSERYAASPEVPVILTSLHVNYTPRKAAGGPVELHYGDRTVSFEVAAPYFRSQENISYTFMLEGFDNTWHELPQPGRVISYTNLPYGEYMFHARTAGEARIHSRELLFPVRVIPPFWMRRGFMLAEALALLGVFAWLIRYYSQRKLKKTLRQAEVTQKLHVERERISRDLHDHVGSNLTYITMTLDNINNHMQKHGATAQEKLSDLSDFTRSTMQQLRETIWAINREHITLTDLKARLHDYTARMTDAAGMQMSISLEGADEIVLKPSYAIHVYRIIQELVNNAVKHSRGSEVMILLSAESHRLHVTVRDNGVGISSEGNGYGLKNMSERISEMGGTLSITSRAGAGTEVQFSVPHSDSA